MARRTILTLLPLAAAVTAALHGQTLPPLRPPAVPLVAHDPYFSIWSATDRLTDAGTVHWTGKPNTLTAMVRVDGKTYRVMGGDRRGAPALDQTSVEVLPTRTIYQFTGAGVAIGLTFLTPALPDDLDVLSRPLTYIEWTASSSDGQTHEVAIYFEAGADLVVNTPDQPVVAARYLLDGEPILRMGSQQQPVLAKRGDDLRIDWGYLYLAPDRNDNVTEGALLRPQARRSFETTGRLPNSDDFSDRAAPRRGSADVLALTFDLGEVGSEPASRYLMIAYDDLFSIEYFYRKERAWWRRNGEQASGLLRDARRDHDELRRRSIAFDDELMADLRNAGGEKYARLAALAYRQMLAAHKLVANIHGEPMYFPKENFSNGCIATVDVIYPSSPFTLLFNPRLLEAQLRPVLEYAAMPRWKWPFAPHDLGTYPQANGQVYGGGEETEENQMPVEESGNMLIMLAALAHVEGNAAFADKYWPQLTRWAEYLKQKGLDPENQLSTDDFAGHLAHNANLSIKAILALGAYAKLAEMTGRTDEAASYRKTAEEFASKWPSLADDGDHYRLAFDKSGTWSQKYNLVWDKLLGLNLFPHAIAQKEIRFYRTKQNRYGLPLDNRRTYTKLDWILWTATLADDDDDFRALVAPAYDFANESPSRVPLTDWYDTLTAKQEGFQARSVVGGLFIKMLADPALWKKYASRGMAGASSSARTNTAGAPTASGLDLAAIDRSVNPCVNFYQYACGTWRKNNPVPPDRARWNRFAELAEQNLNIEREILEQAADASRKRTEVEQKIGDFYASCTDEASIEASGVRPLQAILTRINGAKTKAELMREAASLHRAGIHALFAFSVRPDAKNAQRQIANVDQGGLGLPDRDYYLRDDPHSVELRKAYETHIQTMFNLLARAENRTEPAAAAKSQAVMKIETSLAKASLDRVARRNPNNLYHPMTVAQLSGLAPGIDWPRYFTDIGAAGVDRLNVGAPGFFEGLNAAVEAASLEDLKAYLAWRVLDDNADLLPKAFREANFAFYGKTLSGAQEMPVRWKQCVQATDRALGEALGQKFVEVAFSGPSKAKALELVGEIEREMGKIIDSAEWLTPATRTEALKKLSAVTNKIGYPDRWRDYSSLEIARGDYFGDSVRARAFELERNLAKLGKPVDKTEWNMTPPTVNAYYNGSQNNINFPAGILQPPFYNPKADDAVNYGAIGVVIGHELTHGFDDQGRRYDGDGNLRDWWTPEDAKAFTSRADCMVKEYGSFSPVPGVKLNGKLTLGENAADNGGLRLAYMALMDSLAGKVLAKKDGLTPQQRFFLGYAQIWCENTTEENARLQAKTNPHSPGEFRVNGVVRNLADFAGAFSCKPGDPMAAADPCRVW